MTRADCCRVGAMVLALVAMVLVAASVGGLVKAAFPGHNQIDQDYVFPSRNLPLQLRAS